MDRNKMFGTIYLAVALALIVLLSVGLRGKSGELMGRLLAPGHLSESGRDENPVFVAETNKLSAEDVTSIKAELRVLPLEVVASEDDKIHVEFKGKASEFCTLYLRGGRLSLVEKKKGLVSGRIQIRLPASWNKGMDLACVSGDVSMDGVVLDSVDLEVVSGAVDMRDCTISSIDMESVSGSIDAAGSFDRLKVETVSGSIKVASSSAFKHKCSFESVSGSVSLSLPHDAGYTLSFESVRGSLTDSITGTNAKMKGESVNGDGSVRISVSTMSGSLKVD